MEKRLIGTILGVFVLAGIVVALIVFLNKGQQKNSDIEIELKEKLKSEISGDIIETFYGDFNNDGKYEMWAQVWDSDGIPYDALFDKSNDLSTKCETNEYNLEIGKEYKQLQIWYVDDAKVSLINSYNSIKLTEEYVNGTSSYWGEDTFYYLVNFKADMLPSGENQQLYVCTENSWMSGRGWGIDIDKSITLFNNENGPKICFNDINSDIEYAIHGDSICVLQHAEYNIVSKEGVDTCLYYPVSYIDGAFVERISEEVNVSKMQKVEGYEEVYNEAMSQELTFESFMSGPASNVYYTFKVESIEFDQCLYNEEGYIYLNGKANGTMNEWVEALGEGIDHQDAQIDVCLEMHIENDVVVEYRWLGAHQSNCNGDRP